MTDTTTTEAPHAAALHHLDALRRGMAALMTFLVGHPDAPTPTVTWTGRATTHPRIIFRAHIKDGADAHTLAVSLGAQPEVQTYVGGSRYLNLNRDFGPVRYQAWTTISPPPPEADEVVAVTIDALPGLLRGAA